MAGRTVLVLGGGVGGLVAANELRRRLDPRDRVVLVEREARHLFQPSLLWLMVGRRRRQQIERPLRSLLARGVELIEAEVRAIDPLTRQIETAAGILSADALVMALGAELAPDAVAGYREAALNFFSPEGAASCARALESFRGGRVVVAVSALPYKCPAAPYEAALLLDDELRRRGMREASQIDLFTPEPQPMPVAGPAMGAAVVGLLEAKGIHFHPQSPIERFQPATAELVLADGTRAGYDLLAAVPPHRAPAAVLGSGLANEAGWIPVERTTLQTAHERVYAVGDVTTITLTNGKPLPKAGVFAHAEALVVAREIAASFAGRPAPAGFDGIGFCWVEAGAGRAAFAVGDFYAEPEPALSLRRPGRLWHTGKVLFERSWIGSPLERRIGRAGMIAGGRLAGFRVEL
jgi:sulfide:quinone oxidoreductase